MTWLRHWACLRKTWLLRLPGPFTITCLRQPCRLSPRIKQGKPRAFIVIIHVTHVLLECREAVNYLVDPTGASATDSSAAVISPVASKGFKAAAKAFEAVVGMEEPPSELA